MKLIYMTAANRWEKKRSFGMGEKYRFQIFFSFFFFTSSEFEEQVERATDVMNECIDACVQMLWIFYLVKRAARWRQLMLEVIHNTYLVGLTQTVKRWNKNWERALGILENQKTIVEHIHAYWWWLFLAYEGWGGRFLLNQPTPALLLKAEISTHHLHSLSQDQFTVA